MVIDIHGHYTTAPPALGRFRDRQLASLADPSRRPRALEPALSDELLVESVQTQLLLQRERGTDLTLFSPRASAMGHHLGDESISRDWSRLCNDVIHRICTLLPNNFAPIGQLPQSPGVPPENCIAELERIVDELGFVGVNLNPDPSGGRWSGPPLFDRAWYPLYEKLCELDVPAMIHVSGSCNPNFHTTGAHYINADTAAFMQLLQSDLFADLPELRLVLPHGGGAAPFHWGRYRGLAQDMGKPPLSEHLLRNVFFDTCVYHQPGMELLAKVVPIDNVLFGSEMVGAVRGIDPESGHHFDDTRRYIEGLGLGERDKSKVLELNARRVYPRLNQWLQAAADAAPHEPKAP